MKRVAGKHRMAIHEDFKSIPESHQPRERHMHECPEIPRPRGITKRLLIGVLFVSIVGFPLSAWTVLSVSVSNSTLAFGTRPANTWLVPQTTVITNNGDAPENLSAKVSPLTDGSNTWTLTSTANGADSIRAQWSTTSESGPWTDVETYDTGFPLAASLPANDSVSFWFRIQTPKTTTSYAEHSTTLTVTASQP